MDERSFCIHFEHGGTGPLRYEIMEGMGCTKIGVWKWKVWEEGKQRHPWQNSLLEVKESK